jgi:hypothetical protein
MSSCVQPVRRTNPGERPATLLRGLSRGRHIEQGLLITLYGAARDANAGGRLLPPLILLRIPFANAHRQRSSQRLIHAGSQARRPHHDQVIVRAHLQDAAGLLPTAFHLSFPSFLTADMSVAAACAVPIKSIWKQADKKTSACRPWAVRIGLISLAALSYSLAFPRQM